MALPLELQQHDVFIDSRVGRSSSWRSWPICHSCRRSASAVAARSHCRQAVVVEVVRHGRTQAQRQAVSIHGALAWAPWTADANPYPVCQVDHRAFLVGAGRILSASSGFRMVPGVLQPGVVHVAGAAFVLQAPGGIAGQDEAVGLVGLVVLDKAGKCRRIGAEQCTRFGEQRGNLAGISRNTQNNRES